MLLTVDCGTRAGDCPPMVMERLTVDKQTVCGMDGAEWLGAGCAERTAGRSGAVPGPRRCGGMNGGSRSTGLVATDGGGCGDQDGDRTTVRHAGPTDGMNGRRAAAGPANGPAPDARAQARAIEREAKSPKPESINAGGSGGKTQDPNEACQQMEARLAPAQMANNAA